jgi:hypothetical protein
MSDDLKKMRLKKTWQNWQPLAEDSIPLDTIRRGKPLFALIVAEQPRHAEHFVRCIHAVGDHLAVECSCSTTYEVA